MSSVEKSDANIINNVGSIDKASQPIKRREAATLVALIRNLRNLSAGGAGRVRSQPHVDARHVEAVATLRQLPDLVPGGELGEADGALGELGSAVRRVSELRERA
ncbi:hypothetical protein Pyn_18901 [Prunus yedoensis var. nudiflora]|uniref:Uncharacterized protein n=1 Tax=Prunus yedoensis var. nudiflora TaxID=2094558 RepID=A0A314YXK2_PRUYE|nr:hypothetical protein Pyn_18901 [Prunus yedoensis var. nudiflora]